MCDGFIPQSRGSGEKNAYLCHYSTSANETLFSCSDLAAIIKGLPYQPGPLQGFFLFKGMTGCTNRHDINKGLVD